MMIPKQYFDNFDSECFFRPTQQLQVFEPV